MEEGFLQLCCKAAAPQILTRIRCTEALGFSKLEDIIPSSLRCINKLKVATWINVGLRAGSEKIGIEK